MAARTASGVPLPKPHASVPASPHLPLLGRSVHVTLENVRLNDYFFAEDRSKIGAEMSGNAECASSDFSRECCFCQPNGVRSTQVGIWCPETRDAAGTRHLTVLNLVSRSQQADGINLHGYVADALIEHVTVQNTGDDAFALWGAERLPERVTYREVTAVRPGVLRPGWYGNCFATYGLRSASFVNITCVDSVLPAPLPQPHRDETRASTSMLVVYTSFGGVYPPDSRILIDGWAFVDRDGLPFTAAAGITGGSPGLSGAKVWTVPKPGAAAAPYYLPERTQRVRVDVCDADGGCG